MMVKGTLEFPAADRRWRAGHNPCCRVAGRSLFLDDKAGDLAHVSSFTVVRFQA